MPPKRRVFRKKRSKNSEQDRRIAKIERVINSRELKSQDVSATGVAPSWSGTLVNLFAPNQGSSDVTHQGDKVAIEKIDIRFNGGQTVAGSTNQIRMIVLRDKSNGIGTTPGNVLEASYFGTANAAQAPFEEDLRKNFEVLFDRTILTDDQHKQFQRRYVRKFKKPKTVIFNANTTVINKGQIKLLLISDQLAPNVGIDYVSRVWFSDL